ncbi:hypothetical protein QQS21_006537 [Conoideocrella luteorostrata]|uniref:Transcription factor CBF/NF-Y/archaeal histone domain-containing protein n=1 Tax=Conoideocrella luteorostrata TaxID=1105319 RepID=A0AAJ0FY73_9HYPO|nr:hypothetical protein QQS21_006537 [Conoideocrella luteorostrata]
MPYNTSAIPPRKEPTGQTQLPLSRVKKIINQDPDVHMCSNNAAFVITLAAEMFIQHLAEESNTQAKLERKPRRNIQYKDVANAVSHQDNLEFLEDIVPKTTPFKKIKGSAQATQARLRGEKVPEPTTLASPQAATPAANGHGSSLIFNGQGSAFTVPLRIDEREDPNEQLELEMRQASGTRNGDVSMSG